mmetsp:Transcript_68756/g.212611  ORF Transcript_68756/g.212611 Transcript_68756/m.212611 type:complete len:273 (+) Transcript_68756:97-915(+)
MSSWVARILGVLIFGTLGPGAAGARGRRQESQGGTNTNTGVTTNPLVARYRDLARHYRDDAREAEAAAALWASRARAAVYGGAEGTILNTHRELERQGVNSLAHSVRMTDRAMSDPRSRKAAEAAKRAAAPYEEAFEEYRTAGDSYAATASGYALRAGNDDAMARQLMSYADQHRLQAGSAAADPFVKQSQLLAKQAAEFRGVAAKYRAKAERIKEALPGIKRMEKAASDYASWIEHPEGAMTPHQSYTLVEAPAVHEEASVGGNLQVHQQG